MTLDPGPIALRRLRTEELGPTDIDAIRSILWAAFADHDGGMTEEDWQHALGGVHVLATSNERIVAHASVIERDIRLDGRPFRTAYVEAVAVEPGLQGTGIGSGVMREVAAIIVHGFELGALATGTPAFYERLGWRRWRGPTAVRTETGERGTPEEDGDILVLETPSTGVAIDLDGTISCEWRPGDVW